MHRYELYNVNDIDKLKKELNAYKETMRTVTEGKLVEDYLKTKDDFYDLKMKIFKLKGEMKAMENKFQEEFLKYQMEEEHLANQQVSILNTLERLDQQTEIIKHQLEQVSFAELFKKIDQLLKTHNEKSEEQIKELESLKEEILQIKEIMKTEESTTSKNKRSTHKSEYRQLQSLLQYPNQVEQQSISKKKNNQVNRQHYSRTKSNHGNSYNPHHYDTKNSGTISMNKAKKTFLNSQYELNKNIVTRTATPKSKTQVKNKEDEQDTDNSTSHKLENHVANPPQDVIDNNANNQPHDAISNNHVANQGHEAEVDTHDHNHPQDTIGDTNIDNQPQATTGGKVVEGNAVSPNNELEKNKNNTDFAGIQLEETENKIDFTNNQIEKTNSSTTLPKKSIEGAEVKQQYFTKKQIGNTENNQSNELNKKSDSFSSFLSLFKRG
ncbi:hypothetical protein [Virgibacillus dokdonensis]|uniref:Uncharacterized protein n=1 Tax=Virgibacillus dokdonensis TaxID=302167 RepID=A0A2K9IVH8_9BACI|nr:hypothetical protein [Virgibacillus dokdonensis]AUJ23772.1 hypothetical protein A21D_00659 [Virgibacillus dokdonensis]